MSQTFPYQKPFLLAQQPHIMQQIFPYQQPSFVDQQPHPFQKERNQPQQDSCAQTCFTIASAVLSKSRVMNKAVSIPNASVTQKTKSAIEGKILCTEQDCLTQIQQRKISDFIL
jgi:hypothetical protein